MDKERALTAALSQIEKNYGKGSVMKLGQRQEMNIEAIPTGSLGLDVALGIGGIPKGRIIEIFGPEASGKTTLALHAIAQAQGWNLPNQQGHQTQAWRLGGLHGPCH